MPAEVATLAVGLVLNSGKFFAALGMTLNSAASKMTTWGLRATMLISAPFIAMIGITGRFAVEFDQAMRNVNASLQLPEAQFADLRKQVIDLSMTTRSTAVDIANSLLMVSQAGLESGEAWHLVEIATHAAGAAFSTTAQTARFLIATMRAYNFTLEDANSLMDQAIFASQKGAGSFDDIANAIGLVGPMAATAGIGFDEVLGAMRALRMGGLNASQAMVSLQGVIRKIIMPTKEMEAVLEATGYESGIAALEVLGLDGVMRLLTRATGGSADKMAALFGDIRATRGAFILMKDDATELTQSIDLLGDAASFEGAMERAREQQYKSLSSQTKRLKNTMMAFGLSLWEIPMPALVKLVDLVRDVALGFMGLSDTTKQWIVIIVAAAAALGPVLLILGKLLAIGSMIVSVALNPLVIALAAVAFAAYKWVTARYHIENLQDAVVAFADIAVQALDWVSERLVGMVDLIGQMAEWGAQAIGAFAQGIINGLGLVVQAINYVVRGIAALLGPGSPPAAMPEIVQWGQNAIDQFLHGMTMGDFGILDDVGDKIASHLRTLDFGGEAGLSEALIQARVALARVVSEASGGGEASVQAWQDLKEAIHDDTGELEQYIRLRIEAGRFEDGLAQAELARKRAMKDLDDERYAIQIRHKAELREADEKVQAVEEKLAQFREQTAEIPERFTRGRRRQLEAELSAAQKERETIRDRQEIEKEEFETRRRQIVEVLDAQVEAAQAKRNLVMEEADWLEAVIAQKQKIADLYKKEKSDVEELGLDLSALTPEALDIGDAIGGIKDQFDKAKEAAEGLFGVWKAFWAGLTGVALDEELKGMTAEERRMYQSGLNIWKAWDKFIGVLDKVKTALQPIVDTFKKIFGGEGAEGGIDWATIFEEGGITGVFDRIVDGIITWIDESWPKIEAKLREWSELFWNWVSEAIINLDEKLQPLLENLEAWIEKPETQNRLQLLGIKLAAFLMSGIALLLEENAALAKILKVLTYLFIEVGARLLGVLGRVALDIATGFISVLALALGEKMTEINTALHSKLSEIDKAITDFFVNLPRNIAIAADAFVTAVENWFIDLYNRIVGESIIPDLINKIVEWFAKLPQLLWDEIEETASRVVERFVEFKDKLLTETIPNLINGVVEAFSKLPGRILEAIEQGLADVYGRFVVLKDDILGVLGDLATQGAFSILAFVNPIVQSLQWAYDRVVGHSIIPDMVKDINASLEGLNPTLGGLTGMTAAGATGGVGGGFAGQLVIQNYWDSSISSKDRIELETMMERTAYGAIETVTGGA